MVPAAMEVIKIICRIFFLIFVDKTCFVLQHTCPLCPQVPAVMRSQ